MINYQRIARINKEIMHSRLPPTKPTTTIKLRKKRSGSLHPGVFSCLSLESICASLPSIVMLAQLNSHIFMLQVKLFLHISNHHQRYNLVAQLQCYSKQQQNQSIAQQPAEQPLQLLYQFYSLG